MPTLGDVLKQARRLLTEGNLPAALALYRQLLEAAPQASELWHEMGIVQLRSGNAEAAIGFLTKATEIDARQSSYFSNLGVAQRQLRQYPQAVASFRRALKLGPATAEMLNNLALALKDSGQIDEALATFDKTLEMRSDYANGYFNRGNLYLEEGKLAEAIQDYRKVLVLNPRDAGAHCKLGVAYFDLAQIDRAIENFDQSLRLQPHYPEVRRNRALGWLTRGEYAKGWPEFEWRLECEGFGKRVFTQPPWDGSPLEDRTVLVHFEQGLGDTLQFIRYLPDVQMMGGRVLALVQSPLIPLLEQSGFGRWLIDPAVEPQFDVHCPLLSLPGLVTRRSGAPFWPGTYLAADAERIATWRQRVPQDGALKVGLSWAGNPDHTHDRFRSVHLSQLEPLANIAGVHLISLQKGPPARQISEMENRMPVIELGDALDATESAFLDSAAVMRSLDLVITVDTALAHLAGGLEVPVWTALQLSPDWRWQVQGETTGWYPTMRLFRQRQFNRWEPVFKEMGESLRRLAARH